MTDFTELANAATTSDAAVIAELAEEAAAREVIQIVDGRVTALVLKQDQRLELIDTEQYEPTPARKTGNVALTDADSFITYVGRHSTDEGTTLWSNIDRGQIVAVIDDHDQGAVTAGWGEHRATLTLKQTPDWTHWLSNDGKFLRQEQFAEHIEDGVEAIRDPDAATMLEVAQTFHAKSGVAFKSTKRLGGEVEFSYEETVQARAGQKGAIEVPEILTLGIAPFEGNELYEVKARIRFRLADGHLSIGYRLIRPDKVRRAAFDDVVSAVHLGADLPVMAGTPRS